MPIPFPRPPPVALAVGLLAACACTSIPPGRSAVDSVRIVNAPSVDRAELRQKLATTATPRFLGLFRGIVYDYSVFDASILQRDLARIERYYQGHGFFGVHSRAARVVHVSPDHVRVEIVVDEGPVSLNRRVLVLGLDDLPPAVAQAVRDAAAGALPAGARFDEETYAAARTAAQRVLTDDGYAYATVQSDAQVDLAAHAVDYAFTVSAGPRAVFGSITIVNAQSPQEQGPSRFVEPMAEAPLRRAMKIRSGETYSTAAIDAATQALLDLEVLASVRIEPKLSDPPSPIVPLTVTLEPAKLHVTRLGGGFELDAIKTEVHALVGWENHDFLGDLRDFSVDARPGVVLYPTRVDNLVAPTDWLPEERLRLQLRQPGFLEARTTAYVRPELNVYPLLVQPNPSASEPVVGYVEPKGAVGVDRRFGKHVLVNLGHNVQGELPFAYIPSLPIAEPLPSIVLSYPELQTVLDFRDDPVHPHAGLYASNDLQAAFGGSATDVRVQPEVRGYVPLSRGVTLAARGSVGLLFSSNYGTYVQNYLKEPLAPQQNLPPDAVNRLYGTVDRDIEIVYFRGFFSGGPSSNRGFPLRGIAPHGIVPFLNPVSASSQVALQCVPKKGQTLGPQCSVPIGGFSLWEASVETRFDVSGPFGVTVFCDAGDVAAAEATIRLDHLHLACGVGARYDTPVGPIRLDVGYRVPWLQVLGFSNETDAANADPTEGSQPRIFYQPIALSFGIGEAF